MKTIHTILGLIASLYLTSCTDSGQPSGPLAPSSNALANVFTTIQETPVTILKARESAKPGENIILQGIVMGSASPFVEGRAIFVLGDPDKLTPCNQNPDDPCKTPWDVCCETPEDIKASTVTVQVVDAEGKVLRESIRNVNGLQPLSKVVVSGIATDTSNADMLILNANAIEVKN